MKRTILVLFFIFTGIGKRYEKEYPNNVWEGINQFCFNFYFELKDKEENILFSPFSITSAFLIVYEGARGNTKEEIEKVFFFQKDEKLRGDKFNKILREINKSSKKYEFCVANALWVQKNFKILKEYLNISQKFYFSFIKNLDFIKEPEKSVRVINSWISKKTKRKIKELISKDIITPLTRVIITSVIFFKGKWLKEFDKKNTKEEDFIISENKKVKVNMMRMEKEIFNYYEDKKIQVLEMPYDGEEISMFIFLPKNFEIDSIDEYINYEKFKEIRESMKKEEIDIYIPKFKMETKCSLNTYLQNMGIKDAFSDTEADFSGITGKRELYISHALHKAFIEVNEEGTEATAATGIVMELKAVIKRKIFRADHPFIFLIYDKKTENIIFFGRIINPERL